MQAWAQMNQAVALRQIRKLWKGSGLRVVACPLPASNEEVAAAEAATSTEDALKAEDGDGASSSAGPRRQTLNDFEPEHESPPKPPPRPPPRRPDIGIALGGIGRCIDGPRQVVPLGKAHGKRPMAEVAAETAAANAESVDAERKRAFRASEEQALEAQRLQRARALEIAVNHPTILQQSLDAWRREGVAAA